MSDYPMLDALYAGAPEPLRDTQVKAPEMRPAYRLEDVRRMYEDGMSLAQIGHEVGVGHSTIRKRLIRAGVRMRAVGGTRSESKRARDRDMADDYRNGAGLAELARAYGLCIEGVRQALIRQGVKRRKVGPNTGTRK